MTLSPGKQLGSYEILSLLGAGGMGEVYRARDTKLGREVAIKVLPDTYAQDPERLARFKREAKLLASLNHTNIATIHGLEESGGTHYLVMEMVPGDTLAERIQHDGAVPIEEALGICTQIAEALEHAHEKGVIHRDLKPANVKVTPDGKVKVLDFGLAKAFAEPSASDVVDSQSPTLMTASPTLPGVILGTAAYMSPEQAKGKPIDKRTDIWAFGCVLYELLTGKMVFAGENVQEIIAGILKGEPEWDALPETTPPGIRALLRRCLQKEARRRLRDAGDLRIQIEDSRNAPTAPVPARPGWRMVLPWALVVLLSVAVGVGIWLLSGEPSQAPLHLAVTLPPGEQLVTVGGGPPIALSPDGMQLVYVVNRGGTRQIYLRSLNRSDAKPIPGTEGAQTPFFSPDGQWIGFSAQGKLKKVSLTGGAPIILCDSPGIVGASWGEDDTIVFTPNTTSPLLRVSADGGTPAILTTLDRSQGETSHRFPQFLPGGKALLFTSMAGIGWDEQDVVALTLASGERHVVVRGGHTGRLLPTGHLVYGRAGSLFAVPFDLSSLEVASQNPVTILEGVKTAPARSAVFTYSLGGSMAYVAASPRELEHRLVWVDRNGITQPIPAPSRNYFREYALSPDGRQAAVNILANTGEIWIYDLERGTLSLFTTEGSSRAPLWTPDGKRIAYRSDKAGFRNIYWRAADGTGPEERLTTGDNQQDPTSWSPDGKILVFDDFSPTSDRDIWVLPMDGRGEAKPFLQTEFRERDATLSPDGRWLAYVSNESGRGEVYVLPFPGPGRKWQVSTSGGRLPRWNPKGGELFYIAPDNKMMVVDVLTSPNFDADRPRVLFEGLERFSDRCCEVAPDGQRFLAIQPVEPELPATQINVVLNWFEELKRRVPTQ